MNKLYYGNNICYTDFDLPVIIIEYTGFIEIDNKYPEKQIIMESKNRITIIPNAFNRETLISKSLFEYVGNFTIKKSTTAILEYGKLVEKKIIPIKINNYSNLLTGNSENIGTLSENMGLKSKNFNIKKTTLKVKTISNLDTKNQPRKYFLKDGSEYRGKYHIHLKSLKMMTGEDYSNDSKELVNEKGYGLLENVGRYGLEKKDSLPERYKK